MKKYKDQISLAIILLISSILLYTINYMMFHDIHHILVFLTEDLAFIPIEILIVTLIIDKFIERREKRKLFQKLNMLIGVFFNEVGEEMLRLFINADPNVDKIRNKLIVTNGWKDEDYKKIKEITKSYEYKIISKKIYLDNIEALLCNNKEFFIKLLENPILLEHETFTELLQALFHLYGEVITRRRTPHLIEQDIQHIGGDVERAYALLAYEWVIYMQYLQNEYPYLFYTAMIHNPYDNRDSEEIEKTIMKLKKKNIKK
ncbi:hypothetical protein [Clostridium ganghwense]|uniref:Uncharacterized protein n=1 Tax=Clostridium ganghwense TaxID=312089 RepID=A0ABT4CLU5_9CLOT|nr:hypothetical protein [Clostridium ganghwense]MCY6369903.1 hypothetical protein [Clostridium ganghwense]